MRLRNLIATIAFMATLLAACEPDDQGELRGSLYFAAGNYLAALDLRDPVIERRQVDPLHG